MNMNTKTHGQISILLLENKKTNTYLGICYEFAIVLENKNKDRLVNDLIDASRGYVLTANAYSLPNELLEKSNMLPDEYKQLFDEYKHRVFQKKPKLKLSPEYEDAIKTGRAQLTTASV